VHPAPRPYRGPAVVNGLPFPATIPTGSARTVAELLARDLTDLLNCHYGKFDECAIAVWGRRDPWHMPAEGTALLFDAPWVALWDKYESIGVQIRQTVGPYTNAYPLGAPKLDFYYVMSLQGESYAISLRSVSGHSPQNPATWHVRGCAFCRAYEVLPL
jgi:hypothetical protein